MAATLFVPAQLGSLTLSNHLVMSPMTRNRAIGNVPNALMATYYDQRAGAGLIITEATSPSPNGLGYPRIPGIFSAEQVAGWRLVTQEVHAKGGHLLLQLMHTGGIGHPANLPEGAEVLAPSAVAAAGEMYTDASGLHPHPTPREMTPADVQATRGEFAQAAKNALEAGFDGIELHSANGYLLEQFLNPATNLRTDGCGGSMKPRCRWVRGVAAACAGAIGPDRVGIRLSPYGIFNDMTPYAEIEANYVHLAQELSRLGLVYLHLVGHSAMGAPAVDQGTVAKIREAFQGTLILSGGYDLARAKADLESGRADLIAFGRPFLANPDLVERLKSGMPLNAPDMATFYTPGEVGYTDYPALVQNQALSE